MLCNTILTPAGSGVATPGIATLGASGPSLRDARCGAICQVNTVSVQAARIVDLRNIFDPEQMTSLGFAYEGVGRSSGRGTKMLYLSNADVATLNWLPADKHEALTLRLSHNQPPSKRGTDLTS